MTVLSPVRNRTGRAEKISPSTMLTTIRIRNASTSVPSTCQPFPLTSCRLRSNDAIVPDRSMTMTGMITAQMVIRYRPGAMSRMSPIVIAMPARIDAPATAQM